jgi:hypothetical protein
MWVVGGNEDTDCERTKNIEEQDTPEDSADCLGNVLARILGLAGSDSDKLNTTV